MWGPRKPGNSLTWTSIVASGPSCPRARLPSRASLGRGVKLPYSKKKSPIGIEDGPLPVPSDPGPEKNKIKKGRATDERGNHGGKEGRGRSTLGNGFHWGRRIEKAAGAQRRNDGGMWMCLSGLRIAALFSFPRARWGFGGAGSGLWLWCESRLALAPSAIRTGLEIRE